MSAITLSSGTYFIIFLFMGYRRESGYYPPGAEFDPNAPWNQSEPEEREFDCLCSQTLSKTVEILSSDYTEEVEEEYDEEGRKCRDVAIGTENINWEEEFHANDYHTPLQLLELFKKYLEDEINGTQNMPHNKKHLESLAKECEDWTEDEVTYMEG